jgi:hypothetical protein
MKELEFGNQYKVLSSLTINEVFGWYGDKLQVTNITDECVFATKLKSDGSKGKLKTWWLNYKGEGYKNQVNTNSSYQRN